MNNNQWVKRFLMKKDLLEATAEFYRKENWERTRDEITEMASQIKARMIKGGKWNGKV